jgi:collagenase-like PrtC family protease
LDDCQDPRLLDQLDRTKAEIIVNENCLRDCPRRARHYELTARVHQSLGDRQGVAAGGPGNTLLERQIAEQELEQFMADCTARYLNRQVNKQARNCNLTPNELKSLYDMGFRYFKIQGRDNIPYCFAYDLTRYTLEPGVAAPLVYKMLCAVILRSLGTAPPRAT